MARNLALAVGELLIAAAPARAAGLLDGDEDFKLLAKLGFEQAVDGPHPEGSQRNQYAWSMAWFKGKLYVGTADFQNDGAAGFRTTTCFTEASGKKLLITTLVGKGGDSSTYDTDLFVNPIVLANEDPGGNGSWRDCSPMRFNDPGIDALFTMYAAGGSLYAGAHSPATGAQP